MSTWYYTQNGQQKGPVSFEDVKALIAQQQIVPSDLVWSEGMTGWQAASNLDGVTWPPPSVPSAMHGTTSFSYAGFWKRFVAALIDSLILGFAGLIAGLFVGLFIGAILGAAGVDKRIIGMTGGFFGYLIGIVLNWLYFTLFESSCKQATPGKMALGIIVTDAAGRRVSFARANGRYWGKILSGLILAIGYMMAGFTEKKQALHDMIADCLVINKP